MKENDLHQMLEQTEQYANTLHHIHSTVDEIKDKMQQASYPIQEMQQISMSLETNLQQLKQPLQQQVVHHHHATKVIWATAALFLVVCLLLTGWYHTANKLDLYEANDTKYRYLKLEGNIAVAHWCRIADSMFIADTNLRNVVLQKEEEKQTNMEMLQRAIEMEEEAEKLRQQANKRDGNETKVMKKIK